MYIGLLQQRAWMSGRTKGSGVNQTFSPGKHEQEKRERAIEIPGPVS